jgi:Coenzyme PQQ synthesis protein D (PqqD)
VREVLLNSHGNDGSALLGDWNFPGLLAPAEGTRFFFLGHQKILFSESKQEMYELNDLAAFIWCQLEEQRTLNEICSDLIAGGIGGSSARKYLHETIRGWLRNGILRLEYSADCFGAPEFSLAIRIAEFGVRIQTQTERVAVQISEVFGQLSNETESSDCVLSVIEVDAMAYVFRDGSSILCCPGSELIPQLKAYVTERIVNRRSADVAFHAATLVRHGKALLISGPPGAGKSTLTARLLEEDFEYAGDDVTLIQPDGEARGVPFPITLKSGSWESTSRFRPELDHLTTHDRPDSLKVRFLKPRKIALRKVSPVGWIIFIRRTLRGSADLAPLSKSETMQKLIESCYSPQGKLTLKSCNALRRMITRADSFDLTYSDLESAKDAIIAGCHV